MEFIYILVLCLYIYILVLYNQSYRCFAKLTVDAIMIVSTMDPRYTQVATSRSLSNIRLICPQGPNKNIVLQRDTIFPTEYIMANPLILPNPSAIELNRDNTIPLTKHPPNAHSRWVRESPQESFIMGSSVPPPPPPPARELNKLVIEIKEKFISLLSRWEIRKRPREKLGHCLHLHTFSTIPFGCYIHVENPVQHHYHSLATR